MIKLSEQFEYGSAADSSRHVSEPAIFDPWCDKCAGVLCKCPEKQPPSADELRAQGAAAERTRIFGIIDRVSTNRAALECSGAVRSALTQVRTEIEREPVSGGKA